MADEDDDAEAMDDREDAGDAEDSGDVAASADGARAGAGGGVDVIGAGGWAWQEASSMATTDILDVIIGFGRSPRPRPGASNLGLARPKHNFVR